MSSITRFTYRDPSVGDLIIRTSDGVDFHVHQRRLADVSPVFSDMFSLPQPTSGKERADEKPVIGVSEGSVLWSKLLPILYVAEEPDLSLEDIRDLLEAGRKYDMPGIRSRMKTHLLQAAFLERRPYSVYALACGAGFEDVKLAAARSTLRMSEPEPGAQDFLPAESGRAMYKLLEYRTSACLKAVNAVKPYGRFMSCYSITSRLTGRAIAVLERMQSCNNSSCSPSVVMPGYEPREPSIRAAWLGYMKSLQKSVQHNPNGAPARDISLLRPVIESALNCPLCSKAIFEEADEVSREFELTIEQAVSSTNLL
ncbi:hypothetical protein OH77DRAFT_1519208 [Trametes cingulata]|nr:hypothetical protein OH77DRAFT_1519208 [Trametes cingulata]